MKDVWEVFLGVIGQVTEPSSSIFWVYLCGALVLALVVYAAQAKRTASFRGALSFVFPREVYGHRSVRHDVFVFVVNTLLYSFLLIGPITFASDWTSQKTWLLLHQGLGPVADPSSTLALRIGVTAAVLIVADFAFWLSHIVQHKVPLLWSGRRRSSRRTWWSASRSNRGGPTTKRKDQSPFLKRTGRARLVLLLAGEKRALCTTFSTQARTLGGRLPVAVMWAISTLPLGATVMRIRY